MSEIFSSGLELMLLGMSTVFVFLTVLVIAMTVMSSVLGRQSVLDVEHGHTPVPASAVEQEVAAVAAAAFARFQKNTASR